MSTMSTFFELKSWQVFEMPGRNRICLAGTKKTHKINKFYRFFIIFLKKSFKNLPGCPKISAAFGGKHKITGNRLTFLSWHTNSDEILTKSFVENAKSDQNFPQIDDFEKSTPGRKFSEIKKNYAIVSIGWFSLRSWLSWTEWRIIPESAFFNDL